MAKDRTLKAALERVKGVDHKKLHQKKRQKEAEKRKRQKQESKIEAGATEDDVAVDEEAHAVSAELDEHEREELAAAVAQLKEKTNGEADGWETDESEDGEEDDEDGGVNLDTFEDESDSDSEDDETFYTAAGGSPEKKQLDGADPDAEEAADEDDIPLSDIESLASEERGDIIPHQRLTINNATALTRSLKSIALPSSLPFSATQSVTSAEPITIPDVDDDLNRELAFYKQSLDAVKAARIQLKKEGVPFSRPADYFAEMVKSEEQMGKVRQKMVDEAARKKASSDARRQRDLKKFGKAVQVAKVQERAREKRDTLEKINTLKRKRQGAGLSANEDDMFDVALEDAADSDKRDRTARRGKDRDSDPRKRQKKDEKFGYGGKKKFSKSNDARSAGDVRDYPGRRMKGGAKGGKPRLGKSRRAARG